MRTLNYKTRFIDLASEINSEMPALVVEKVSVALNDERKAVNGSRIMVVGVAYKKDIDDIRESPALDVIRLLEERGAEVVHHDPFIPRFRDGDHDGGGEHKERIGVALSAAELGRADAVVIVTDHSQVDYQQIVDDANLVIDTRNATARASRGRARVVSLAADPKPAASAAVGTPSRKTTAVT
jgi:UDP-N-acetyl-D-glucosamine dehydrogenase